MTTQKTPCNTPWSVQSEFETTIVDSMDNELAQIFAPGTQEQVEIARIMAAGPEMLEALRYQETADADPAASRRKGYYEEATRLRRIAIAKATPGNMPQAPAKTITIHVEGGMVQDVTGIPPGVEVRVEDYDHSDDTQPTWDAGKECAVTTYQGSAV